LNAAKGAVHKADKKTVVKTGEAFYTTPAAAKAPVKVGHAAAKAPAKAGHRCQGAREGGPRRQGAGHVRQVQAARPG